MSAKVYIVGAGPGDPDLITWKGRKLLSIADRAVQRPRDDAHSIPGPHADADSILKPRWNGARVRFSPIEPEG